MKVLTLGTFDIPHLGHAIFLKKCAALGDLTIGLNTDTFVGEFKGRLPLFVWRERAKLLRVLGYRVLRNESAGRDLIMSEEPDLLVVGSDWTPETYYDQIDLQQWDLDLLDVTLLFMGYESVISTSKIKERLDKTVSGVV